MTTKLVTNERESDGRFALRLESKRAVKRDAKRQVERLERERRVVAENAEWCKAHGYDPSEAAFMFA